MLTWQLRKVLEAALQNGFHSAECPSIEVPPEEYEQELKNCTCWVADADKLLNPERWVPPGTTGSRRDGALCKCKHPSGTHAANGLCVSDGCACFTFNPQ